MKLLADLVGREVCGVKLLDHLLRGPSVLRQCQSLYAAVNYAHHDCGMAEAVQSEVLAALVFNECVLHDLLEQTPYHCHCRVAVLVRRKKHVILKRGLESRRFAVRDEAVVDEDGGGHRLDFGGGGFCGGMREREPLVVTVLFLFYVLVFQDAKI